MATTIRPAVVAQLVEMARAVGAAVEGAIDLVCAADPRILRDPREPAIANIRNNAAEYMHLVIRTLGATADERRAAAKVAS